MAMKVRYTVVNGEVLSENRGGVKRDYLPDTQGNTIGLLDSTQTITDTFSYYPYGEVASRTGTTATPFQFLGTLGYYRDSASRTYVRARTLNTAQGRWMTQDPIGFKGGDYNLYRYVKNRPTVLVDPSGLIPWKQLWLACGAGLAGQLLFALSHGVWSPEVKHALCIAGVSCVTVLVVWFIVDALGAEYFDTVITQGAFSGCLAAAAASVVSDYVCNDKKMSPFCAAFIGAVACLTGVIVGAFQSSGGAWAEKDPNALKAVAGGIIGGWAATLGCSIRR